jgi:hypothetical protein
MEKQDRFYAGKDDVKLTIPGRMRDCPTVPIYDRHGDESRPFAYVLPSHIHETLARLNKEP